MQVRPDGSVQLTDWFAARPAAGQDECDRTYTFLLDHRAATDRPARGGGHRRARLTQRSPALPLCQLAVLDARARDQPNKHVALTSAPRPPTHWAPAPTWPSCAACRGRTC
ncbi:MAG: hypothetical protein R2726_15560 [Acidimicrobiales bacterium]